MEGPTSKKTKEPPKNVNHTRNIKFSNPLLLQEAYQRRKGETQEDRRTTQESESHQEHQVLKPPPLARSISKKER
jgi:hypothetical protein